MRESEIEKYLKNEVQKLGGLCYKFISPGNSGVPDRICFFKNGVVILVETKAPKKDLRKLQEWQKKRINDLGIKVLKIDSKIKVDEFIKKIKAEQIV